MTGAVLRWLDVRSGEGSAVASSFVALLAIVAAHTSLETARDGLFLQARGPGELGAMYAMAALLVLVGGSASGHLTAALGPRRALLGSQMCAAIVAAAFFVLPPSPAALVALYGATTVLGAVLVPQLWSTTAAAFDPAQSRRLFSVVALAGVLGAVVGSAVSAAVLRVRPAAWLLLVASAGFVASAVAVAAGPRGRTAPPPPRPATSAGERRRSPFAEEPILRRIAVVTALGAVTALLVDYAFKTAIARAIAPEKLPSTLAVVGLVTSAAALVAQLGLARVVVARAGVVGAVGFASSLAFTTTALAVVTGGAPLLIGLAKVAEGATRHSVHRTATELLYLAVPAGPRERAKPIIEGAIARAAQAAVGLALIAATGGAAASAIVVALLAAGVAAAWGGATFQLWRPYVALFRRSLGGGIRDASATPLELDAASVDLLVEALGSPDSHQVTGALAALARRGRTGLVPALVLLHDDAVVLEEALALLATTPRRDWIRFAERLVTDRRWTVRRAALRALTLAHARADRTPREDEHPWARGYLAAIAPAAPDRVAHVLAVIDAPEGGRDALLGVLTALGDADATRDAAALLDALTRRLADTHDDEVLEAMARAAAHTAAPSAVPWLVARLARREGRSAVRRALASMGPPALRALITALEQRDGDRLLRAQIPAALAGLASREAADALFATLASDPDGLLRYRCLRALEGLVHGRVAAFSAADVRPIAHRAMAEHFRLLALRAATTPGAEGGRADPGAARRVLDALLAEKARQALMRAYRTVGLAYPADDLRRAFDAAIGGDAAARSAAVELVDALLVPRRGRRRHDELRDWLRLAVDPLPIADRVARAGAATTPERARAALLADPDPIVKALARELTTTAEGGLTAEDPRG